METGTWLGVGALLVSAAGALNSMRAGKREDRSGAFTEIQAVVKTLKEENERLEKKLDESEDECRKQIQGCKDDSAALTRQLEEMRATIVRQANQLNELQRRAEGKTRTRTGDTNG